MNEVANFFTAFRVTQKNNLIANISEYCTSHNGLCYTRFKQIHDNFEMLHKDMEKIKKSEQCTLEAVCEKGICSYLHSWKERVFNTSYQRARYQHLQ